MVVVGGAGGVVSSVARRMATRGCNIVLAGRNPERLEEVAPETARDAKQRREPLFHLSSPIAGWGERQPERHRNYIDPKDFAAIWQENSLTVEVEAKAKALPVARLQRHRKASH